jgi:chitin synthase
MNPLELEMYHQIKNVIGVNPTFYEYMFMVDADTTVDPYSVNRLISAYVVVPGPFDATLLNGMIYVV